MALTELGYERPTYDDILEAQIDRAKLLFGDDIDTNENTPLGKYIRLNVTDLADVYEILEHIYYSRFPNTATGISLDRLCPFAGIARNPATYAKHEVKFTGVAGEYVPEAFEVSAGDILFHTYDSVQFDENGTATAIVECEEAGTIGNVTLGSIDTIVNPDTNVESVEHINISEIAEDLETDTDLRYRFNQTISGAGAGTNAAIEGAIARVALVDGVEVVENNTDVEVNGIPPHSFACYVLAPESQDALVAEAIFNKKPMGIKSVGDVEVEIIDDSGVSHTVAFYRTIKKDIYIKLTIATNNFFESEGVTQIKNNIVTAINSLKNGEDVYLSSIYGYIYKVNGVVNVSELTMSNDGAAYSTNDIAIEASEVARISADNIEVVVSNE